MGLEARPQAQGQHHLVEPHLAAADLAHFEGHEAAGPGEAMQLGEDLRHGVGPGLDGAGLAEGAADGRGVKAGEPAAQPVVAGVVHHVEEGRGGDGEGHAAVQQRVGAAGIAREEAGILRRPCQMLPLGGIQPTQQLAGLLEDQRVGVAVGRYLVALGVDLALLLGAEGLVGGQGVHRKEARAVARQAIGGHHADPAVEVVQLAAGLACQAPVAQAADLRLGVRALHRGRVVGVLRERLVGSQEMHVSGGSPSAVSCCALERVRHRADDLVDVLVLDDQRRRHGNGVAGGADQQALFPAVEEHRERPLARLTRGSARARCRPPAPCCGCRPRWACR